MLSWDLLRELKHRSSLPWCVIGDCNSIPGNAYSERLVQDLKNALDDSGSYDIYAFRRL